MEAKVRAIKRPTGLPEGIRKVLDDVRAFVETFNWDQVSDRRIDILKVFLQLAATQGYSAITMRSLAAELKLKAPSIYSHFPGGKDEIISLSLRWQACVFGLEVLEGTSNAENAESFLDLLARQHCRVNLVSPENYLWDMIVSSDRVGKFLPMDLRDEMHAWIEICVQLYASAAEVLGYDDYQLKARQVITAIDAVHGWASWDGTEAGLERIQDQASELCRNIMEAKRPSARA